jgi:hypothetical protein
VAAAIACHCLLHCWLHMQCLLPWKAPLMLQKM